MHWNPDPRSRVALLACLLVASCATVAPNGLPPADLLQPCGSEYPAPRTNGALVKQRNEILDALRACNRDKERLREWAGDLK